MIRKSIKDSIKEHYFNYPSSKLRVREIERKLRLPLPSVIRYCRELEKEGILAIEKIGNVTLYTANKGDDRYTMEKKLYNLRIIHTSGIIDSIRKELSNPPMILFGSFSKGEDTEQSDIDIYIETPSGKTLELGQFERILKRPIQLFRHKSLKTINPHLANNIINGIALNGQVEVFR